ncbi:Hybrid signal transduction histidine kinase B [Lachnellula subtilissima]|uniref:Hybrid signal transduction histidine kinase B n=1 Tax=Lachnellula subtilissima TaxID=602034 RepID=A0A8H8RJN3_9HELO|nr:Hybrid signal transduction histidine kinase B [Lachnellula subtilissima]
MSDPELHAQTQLSLVRARERARVRDLLRYYKTDTKPRAPLVENSLSEICAAEHAVPSIALASESEAQNDIPDDSQLLSHDPTLTAFAQLGAYRMNCERSFISIMTPQNQFILAEATRSVSLYSQEQCDEGDEVYLGPRVLDMVWGVCPNTIQVFTAQDDSLDVATSSVIANRECYVMNDMSAMDSFKDRPYCIGWPYMKFYAEVPIHSPSGHVIGTYCVVDNKPRDGLSKKGLGILNEISSAIMKHLELVQMQHDLQRAGRMVKGLNLFVEGKGALQDFGGNEANNLESLQARPHMHQAGSAQTLTTTPDRQESAQDSTDGSAKTALLSNHNLSENAAQTTRSASSASATDFTTQSSGLGTRERKLSSDSIATIQEISSGAMKQLFSRASYTIRKALDLDGVMFIDACVRDIAVDPATAAPESPLPESLQFRGISDIPADERKEWFNESDGKGSIRFVDDPAASQKSMATTLHAPYLSSSELLGYSAQASNSADGLSSQRIPLPKSTLRGLLGKYRYGHIFDFDEDGSLVQTPDKPWKSDTTETGVDASEKSNSENEKENEKEKEKEKEKLWTKQLLDVCPGARSMVFLALWDPQRDQWFAGSLAWSKNSTRTLESADIGYLAAFGSCIMSEKSRLDALTADRAKADFISSVSHELRSPLHGVLASAEALQETPTNLTQDDMIRTIMVCGGTLLDTMDQILDYAKTSLSANPSSSRFQKNVSHNKRTTNLDLSQLVEDVVEGVSVGHTYRRSDNKHDHMGNDGLQMNVLVIVSVDWQTSWNLESDIGSWKRIIMNLFGNALKYTTSGFVRISLRTKTTPADSSRPPQQVITLQIEDSGKGMSQDYLRHGLFTPFTQEDPHAVGTGLGLSIVRQLVVDLRGKIDVHSEVGYGTTVNVSVPIRHPSKSQTTTIQDNNSFIMEIKTRCHGLKLCFIGFEYYPDIAETPSGLLSAHARCILAMKESLTAMAADWFGLEVTTASSADSANGDILMGLRSKSSLLKSNRVSILPSIIFEDTIAGDDISSGNGVVTLSQPAGPHKLARILAQCLDYRNSSIRLPSLHGGEKPNSPPVFQEVSSHRNSNRPDILEIIPAGEASNSPNSPNHNGLPGLATIEENITVAVSKMTLDPESTKLAVPQIPFRSKVLLVEDNSINLKILVNYMKIAKQDYVTAVNGLEALHRFEEEPLSFKVIFMDLAMPVMDGLTSSRRIRAHESNNNIPRTRIVALTCFSSAEYQRDAALSGIDIFLIKPVPMKTLKPILEMEPNDVGTGD